MPGKKDLGELDHNFVTITFTSELSVQYRDFLQTHPNLNTEVIAGKYNDILSGH